MDYDVIIAGGGAAGLTAAIYAARGGLKVGIVTGGYVGGRTSLISKIENYSGIAETDGFFLTNAMKNQAEVSGAVFIDNTIKSFDLLTTPKSVMLESGEQLSAEYIILTMGTNHKTLGIPNESNLVGRGISYCANCDGVFYKNKAVAVCGGGNSALVEALYLSNIASEVYLIHKRNTFKAVDILVQKAKQKPNIKLIMDSVVQSAEGDPLQSITIKNVLNGETSQINISGLFVAVGSLPNTDKVRGQVALDDNGYIITDVNMKTSVQNVFAAGDIRVTPLRQIITACGDGAIAGDAAVKDRLGR